MPALTALVAFMIAAVALVLLPGPSVMYVVARSVDQGRRAGITSALGGAFGNLVHVTAATLGLSALLASSAVAFSVVKYAGAAYLIYLGVRTLRARGNTAHVEALAPRSMRRVFSQAIVVNAFNPKTALFFLAFLPQFTDPARGALATQILVFGCLFVLLALCTDSLYALAAGTLGAWLRHSARFRSGQRRFSGCVYLALGLAAAFSGSHRQHA